MVNPEAAREPIAPKDATVLVVEDNVSNFVLIARMLGYMGIHCEWKTSGYEVVEYADTLPRLDLVLMDIRLPYEDGYGALKKIRSSPSLKDTLVVAVTAEARSFIGPGMRYAPVWAMGWMPASRAAAAVSSTNSIATAGSL